MKKVFSYRATGNVLGYMWGAGLGTYSCFKPLEAPNFEELIKIAKERLENNTLLVGKDFENLKGAVLFIQEKVTINFEGEDYSKIDHKIEFIGNLTEDEKDFLLSTM